MPVKEQTKFESPDPEDAFAYGLIERPYELLPVKKAEVKVEAPVAAVSVPTPAPVGTPTPAVPKHSAASVKIAQAWGLDNDFIDSCSPAELVLAVNTCIARHQPTPQQPQAQKPVVEAPKEPTDAEFCGMTEEEFSYFDEPSKTAFVAIAKKNDAKTKALETKLAEQESHRNAQKGYSEWDSAFSSLGMDRFGNGVIQQQPEAVKDNRLAVLESLKRRPIPGVTTWAQAIKMRAEEMFGAAPTAEAVAKAQADKDAEAKRLEMENKYAEGTLQKPNSKSHQELPKGRARALAGMDKFFSRWEDSDDAEAPKEVMDTLPG